MAFICGFFNSINGDRKYNAEQMNNPYHRVVSNGVFANANGQSTDLQVQAVSDMDIKVLTGEGIFAGKWAKLDTEQPFTVPTAHVSYARIDSVVVRIDSSEDVRAGSIIYKKGTAASSPTAPALESTGYVKEYRLANIRVAANTTTITQADITDTRPTSECGFVSNLLANSDVTALFQQWNAQFAEWFEDVKETLTSATLIRSFTSHYTTETQGETVIPINIEQYNKNLDILQVFVNGLRLIPDDEYIINSNSQITLAEDVDNGTPVSFVVYKSVDGSDAETVVQQVATLQSIQITNNAGGVKIFLASGNDLLAKFIEYGMGFHTIYAPTGCTNVPVAGGEFTCFGHLTGKGTTATSTYGWLFAIRTNGEFYANYLRAGTWSGWKRLDENDTGWQTLTLASGVTEYSSAWTPKYRKIGSVVHVKGAVKGVTSANTTVATLPAGFRPLNAHPFAQVTSRSGADAYFARWQIGTAGSVVMEATSQGTPATADFFPIDTCFLID